MKNLILLIAFFLSFTANASLSTFATASDLGYTPLNQAGDTALGAMGISPPTDVIPLYLQASASQTADLQQWQATGGSVLSKVDHLGAATFVSTVHSNVTASKAAVFDSGKKLISSAVTATELGYLAGVTSNIQDQIDAAGGGGGLDPWAFQAKISGGGWSLDTSDNATFKGVQSTSGTLQVTSGSATGKILCSTTVAPTGTTCSSGSESLGVAVTVPTDGNYMACVDFAQSITIDSAAHLLQAFHMMLTPTNAQTVTTDGNGGTLTYLSATAITIMLPRRACGMFFGLTGSTEYGFRLMYTTTAGGGTIATNEVQGDGAFDNQITFSVTRL